VRFSIGTMAPQRRNGRKGAAKYSFLLMAGLLVRKRDGRPMEPGSIVLLCGILAVFASLRIHCALNLVAR